MALTAFTSRLGTGQGRIASALAASGEYAFVLGDAEPGYVFDLAPGDYVEVAQAVDLTDQRLLRAALRMKVPEGMPSGLAWEASLLVDGAKRACVRGRAGLERAIGDLAANVSRLSGVHSVAVRLELVAS